MIKFTTIKYGYDLEVTEIPELYLDIINNGVNMMTDLYYDFMHNI